ncbi:MAG: dynamin [Paenibacillaceae bacterium]|jgi:GTPase Era involved in 16S rRNA processing|nr:dynamin [Paenibacillaceae bacterium]
MVTGMKEAAEAVCTALRAIGGDTQARKLTELWEKQEEGELHIAFCGHFSAGKSTLLNRLCQYPLLPSGPVPTSANIVRIRNGAPAARLFRRGKEGEGAVQDIPLEQLEEACRDGERVEAVELYYPLPLLSNRAALLDTPGIDSSDDAHQAATQSAMHLADAVFYVMDYNYVQSEINFLFARKLQEAGKPLFLIINQIDKHREQELTFAQYRQGVLEAFHNWGIEPGGFVFLSLRQPEHAHNEWSKFISLVDSLVSHADALKRRNLEHTTQVLVREALRSWREERILEKTLYLDALGPMKGLEAALEEQTQLAARQNLVRAAPGQFLEQVQEELQKIIENANITPAVTRERAAAYLQTRKPGFKTGWLSSGAKTDQERSRRLGAFACDLQEQVQTQLYWHGAEALRKHGVAAGLSPEELKGELEQLQPHVAEEWLAGLVHAGPDFTGEYVLNYCRQIAEELRRICRRQCRAQALNLQQLVRSRAERELAALVAEEQQLGVVLAAANGLKRMEREEAAKEAELMELAGPLLQTGGWDIPVYSGGDNIYGHGKVDVTDAGPATDARPVTNAGLATDAGPGWQERVMSRGDGDHGEASNPSSRGELPIDGGESIVPVWKGRMEETSSRLYAAAGLLSELPQAAGTVRALRQRAAQLADNRFTVALFGAFSAGKSSFANAMMGQRLLPVSPNPTTAAINTIVPPERTYPSGTVRIKLKTEDVMREEMIHSLQAIGLDVPEEQRRIAEALVERIRKEAGRWSVAASGKSHLAFLKAVEKGWEQQRSRLGQELLTGPEEFPAYVACEEKACFVQEIILYEATPLTRQGVVLVDTPGADSINARHTGVAFGYIKNADAVLFITYYNHAFSQADREFLMQLGRVKNAMELDKMFFIVNAADLAADQEELEEVLSHVEDNLVRMGISNPRVYSVSSKLALEGILAGSPSAAAASGMRTFEEAFQRYAEQELAFSVLARAEQELRRCAELLDNWIAAASGDEDNRRRFRESLIAAKQQALGANMLHVDSHDRSALRQELEEQLYYVKQRMNYRFSDFYRHSFHPASFREDIHDLKVAFKAAWQELRRMIGYQLSQEVLAVTLRAEQFLSRRLEEKARRQEQELGRILEGYTPGGWSHSFQTPQVDPDPTDREPELKWFLGFYRNGRQFFEGDGSRKLLAALQDWFQVPVEQYLRLHAERLHEDYILQFGEIVERHSLMSADSISDYCSGLAAATVSGVHPEHLAQKGQELEALLHNNVD